MKKNEVDIKGSFEVLTNEEWERYLGTTLFNKIKIDINKFDRYKRDDILISVIGESNKCSK